MEVFKKVDESYIKLKNKEHIQSLRVKALSDKPNVPKNISES